MSSRHRARERALQILFQWDARKGRIEDAITSFYDTLYSEHSETRPAPVVSQHAEHWRIERMPAVDRNVLRLAVYEMKSLDTPPAVAIDEAIELARRFSGEESVQFINGVLDAARREFESAAGR